MITSLRHRPFCFHTFVFFLNRRLYLFCIGHCRISVCVIAVSKSHEFLLKVRRLSSFFSTTTPSRRRVVIFFHDDARDSTSTTSRCFFHDVRHYDVLTSQPRCQPMTCLCVMSLNDHTCVLQSSNDKLSKSGLGKLSKIPWRCIKLSQTKFLLPISSQDAGSSRMFIVQFPLVYSEFSTRDGQAELLLVKSHTVVGCFVREREYTLKISINWRSFCIASPIQGMDGVLNSVKYMNEKNCENLKSKSV